MKSFSLLKIPVMLVLGAGAMLVLAPSSRAQAEIAPDHYDTVEALSASPKPKASGKTASRNLGQGDATGSGCRPKLAARETRRGPGQAQRGIKKSHPALNWWRFVAQVWPRQT